MNDYVYVKISNVIKKRIIDGTYRINEKLSNEYDLCSEFKVSRATLRKALNLLEKEKLIARSPKKGTIVLDPLEVVEINMVGISSLFSNSPKDFLTYHVLLDISQGIIEEAAKNKMKVKYTWVDTLKPESYRNIYDTLDKNPDAPFIFLSPNDFETFIEDLHHRKANYVLSHVYECPFNSVIVDFESGAYDVVSHLIDQGHKRIAIILYGCKGSDKYFNPRLDGYKKALDLNGIKVDNNLIKENTTPHIDTSNLLKELFSSAKPPTAIFCTTDRIALDVINNLQNSGKKIPRDIAIAGYDNILPSYYVEPALTTVDCKRYESGAEAVKLLKRILKRQNKSVLKTYIKPEVVIRESTLKNRI